MQLNCKKKAIKLKTMDFTLESIFGYIRANFFYDLRSTVISSCFLLGIFFLFKLLKDNGEKVNKSLKYLTCVVLCFVVVFLLY